MFVLDSPLSTARKVVSVLISAGLVAYICTTIDIDEMVKTLAQVSALGALLILCLYTGSQLLSAFKWRIFLGSAGIVRSFTTTVQAYFLGMFINVAGLGVVGGDAARCFAVRPEAGRRAACLATVVGDRVHGLLVVLLIALVALFFCPPFPGRELALLGAAGVLGAGCFAWWFGPGTLSKLLPNSSFAGHVVGIAKYAFPQDRGVLFATSMISAVFHLMQIAAHIAIARQLGMEVPIVYYLVVVPAVNMICCLPISANGLGLREAMYLLLLTPLGVDKEVAVAFGAVWVITVTVVGLAGYATSRFLAGSAAVSRCTR